MSKNILEDLQKIQKNSRYPNSNTFCVKTQNDHLTLNASKVELSSPTLKAADILSSFDNFTRILITKVICRYQVKTKF